MRSDLETARFTKDVKEALVAIERDHSDFTRIMI